LNADVIDPGIDDDVRPAVVSKEQAEAAEEFRTEPVPVRFAERIAETVFRPAGVARDDLEHQLHQGGEQLDVGVAPIAMGIGALRPPGRLGQIPQLADDRVMEEERPTVDDHRHG
jgi:hypothetical protein